MLSAVLYPDLDPIREQQLHKSVVGCEAALGDQKRGQKGMPQEAGQVAEDLKAW